MQPDDVERRLEPLAQPDPPPGLETRIHGAVQEALDRPGGRPARLLLVGVLAVLLMGVVFFLGRETKDGAGTTGPKGGEGEPSWWNADLRLGRTESGTETPEGGCPVDPDLPPRMTLDLPPSGLDFGDVRQGELLEQDVAFRSEGKGPLCVERVETGCGCIKASLVGDRHDFGPGQSGRIHIVLDTRGRDGEQRKSVKVHTNEVDVPVHAFTVRANVVKGLRLSPYFLNLGRVGPGEPATGTLRLRAPKADGAWTVTGVHGTDRGSEHPVRYQWSVEEVPDPKDRVLDLHITHPGLAESGVTFQDVLTVQTNHPGGGERTIRVYLLVTEPLIALPSRVVLGFVPSGSVSHVRILRGEPGGALHVTGHSFLSPEGKPLAEGESGFVATTGTNAEGTEPWVDVRYDGKERPKGPVRATLVLTTDERRMPELRIDCVATVR